MNGFLRRLAARAVGEPPALRSRTGPAFAPPHHGSWPQPAPIGQVESRDARDPVEARPTQLDDARVTPTERPIPHFARPEIDFRSGEETTPLRRAAADRIRDQSGNPVTDEILAAADISRPSISERSGMIGGDERRAALGARERGKHEVPQLRTPATEPVPDTSPSGAQTPSGTRAGAFDSHVTDVVRGENARFPSAPSPQDARASSSGRRADATVIPREADEAEQDAIQISIGRIDVRVPPEPAAEKRTTAGGAPSLAEYLRDTAGRRP